MNIIRSIRSIDYMPKILPTTSPLKAIQCVPDAPIVIVSTLTPTITSTMNYRDAENPNIESQLGIVKLLVRYHTACAKKIHPQTHTHIMTFRRRGAVYVNMH